MAKQNRGKCEFCGKAMTRGGLSKHFAKCQGYQEAVANANKKRTAAQNIYHLVVRDKYSRDFWLHLEMRGNAQLQDLDSYLRAIWLECCGHLSQFSFGGWAGEELPMRAKVDRFFDVGNEVTHIYDFGSSSETLVKVAGVRRGHALSKHPIYLLARNDRPQVACAKCDQIGEWLCLQCLYEENEFQVFCDTHADPHGEVHDEYGDPMPLFNSPRVGICGYDGPATPPY